MGDSTCFMQPFCYASGISNEANENNPIHALGQSISFGRFMTESLAWEKWSSFSHNRYVEEAERYSKPGSVAQKKAFFEAHYKKLAAQKAAAAALLEQANNDTENNATREEDEAVIGNDSHSLERNANCEMVKEEQDVKVEASVVSGRDKVEENEPEMEEEAVVGNSMKVELENQFEDIDNTFEERSEKLSGTAPIMTPTATLKQVSSYEQEMLASTSKKKPPVTSFKSLKAKGTSNFTTTPIKSTAHCKKNDFITPMSNKPSALSNGDKKRYTPKSLQMSVNFTPIKELNRFTASVMRKFESTRIGASSSKASKDSVTPLRTPTMASKEQKLSSLTPLTEKRNKTPIDSSASRNHTAGPKWRMLSGENKMRSPIISSPFSLRTEERAARRKKKLEEKFNANVAQKVQLHTKLKEKAGTEIRKLRQSFCFQARPLPDFYKERKEASKIETRQVPLMHSESPNEGRKFTKSIAESKTSIPPNKPFPSMKNNGTKNFQGKSGRNLNLTTHENTSPNIQHWNQNDRSYK